MSGDEIKGLWVHVLSGRIVEILSTGKHKVQLSFIHSNHAINLNRQLFLEDFTPLDEDYAHTATTAADLLLLGYELAPAIRYGNIKPGNLKWKVGAAWGKERRRAMADCIRWHITARPAKHPAGH